MKSSGDRAATVAYCRSWGGAMGSRGATSVWDGSREKTSHPAVVRLAASTACLPPHSGPFSLSLSISLYLSLSLCVRFNGHFSRWIWVSRCLLKQRMMEVVVTTGAVKRAKFQSNHYHQQTNIQFFYRPDALPVTQPTVSKHWRENITSHGLAYPKLPWGLPTLSLTTNSSWLPWGGLSCLSSALWCQYPWT